MAEARRTSSPDPGDLKGARILVVEARFYEDISDELMKGATRVLDAASVVYDRLAVPGSLEIPPAITIALDAAQAAGKPYEGAVALGCVIRGDTIHFEIVSFESSRGLMEISRTRGVPIGNGILTVDNDAQAWMRAKIDEGDKGGDAARAALALIRLKRRLAAG
jgi:6,7-dimethyl-8-ribityllumazine synthase